MFKFKNRGGSVITTNDAATANDYRNRDGFTEIMPVVVDVKPVVKPDVK